METGIKILGIVAVAGLLLSCAPSNNRLTPTVEAETERQVRHAFNGLVDASKSLDTLRYLSYVDAEHFVGLNANGTVWRSRDELSGSIQQAFDSIARVTSLDFTTVEISVIDDQTAVLVNEYEQALLLKTGETLRVAGGGAQVWSRATGDWKLVSISASNAPLAR